MAKKSKTPGGKTSDFVTGEFYPGMGGRSARHREGDCFYFDPAAWEALVALAGERLRPPRMTRAAIENWRAARYENRRRRALAAGLARYAVRARAYHSRRFVLSGPSRWQRLLMGMEPGAWYGSRELSEMLGATFTREIQFVLIRFRRKGFLRRVANPDWKGNARFGEPKYLWALTDAGAEKGAELREAWQTKKDRPDVPAGEGGGDHGRR